MSRETHIAKVKKFCHIDEKTACQDYLNNVFIDYASVESIYRTEEERLKNYGRCQECGNIRECIEGAYDKWCNTCNAARFRQLFSTWTSGNVEIDYFIQHAQAYAWDFRLALEWYPWEMFSEIEMIGKGGYGTVFRAKTKIQKIWYWDQKNNDWHRLEKDNKTLTHNEDFYYNEYVALKTIGETETEDFLNERLQRWAYRDPINTVTLYGFTKNETTGQYFHVMRYFKGDLRNRLKLNEENSWQIKIRIVRWIALNLYEIHKAGLIHRDLHPGNVLHLFDGSYDYCQIGDLGLAISVSEASSDKNLSGVMPYMAPELLNSRGSFTQATDVYAFGILMWQISSCEQPFFDVEHDVNLALKISKGLRPKIPESIPPFYQDLMQKCWDADPTKRPTANQICESINNWYEFKYGFELVKEIQEQIDKADKVYLKNVLINKEKLTSHPGAIYTSRPMINITKELATMNFEDFKLPNDFD